MWSHVNVYAHAPHARRARQPLASAVSRRKADARAGRGSTRGGRLLGAPPARYLHARALAPRESFRIRFNLYAGWLSVRTTRVGPTRTTVFSKARRKETK